MADATRIRRRSKGLGYGALRGGMARRPCQPPTALQVRGGGDSLPSVLGVPEAERGRRRRGAVTGERVSMAPKGVREPAAPPVPMLMGAGLAPSVPHRARPPIDADNAHFQSAGDFKAVLNEARAMYSDGSGGPAHAPRSAPSVGSGLAVASWDHSEGSPRVKDIALIAASVPGEQTVPRAELWAACKAASVADGAQSTTLYADASYIVDTCGSADRLDKAKGSRNGDLWMRCADTVRANATAMEVTKVAAHQHPASAISGHQSLYDYLGNHLADAAGAAAERALAASERAEAIAAWESRAPIVAKRLAFVEAWHWRQPDREELLAPAPLLP
jgi:hypothetical protein